jgi:predicted ATPase/DNA-binding winged helix-turn-helix (wHTH) protein
VIPCCGSRTFGDSQKAGFLQKRPIFTMRNLYTFCPAALAEPEMSHQLESVVGERLKFGEFELAPVARALWRRGELVKLGSRAFDILIALASRPGQVLSKDDLTRLVWRGVFVDDTALRVGISALRKALGPGGERCIATIPGRGYCFVHDVEAVAAKPAPKSSQLKPKTDRSPTQARVVGRAESIKMLTGLVLRQRLTTIVGSGGIGKTTVAYPVAEATGRSFPDGARFIDLAAVTDPLHVSSALAAALGVEVRSEGLSPALVAHLRDKRMLLMFDSCEHVVQAAAGLIDGVLKAAPNIYVLATSRETLRTTGEQVYRLGPLATPPLSAKLTAAEAMAFPAVELFVERVAAFIGSYQLSDEDAPLAADICRRLDGIALAIELAAGCMEALGIADIVASLDDRFGLLTRGSRTAAPRQQSLRSTLDWSYGLLIDAERTVLQRLAVFVGTITMDAAARVAGPQYAPSELFELLGNLVAKSMVSRDSSSASTRYRLLETVQAYATEKLAASGELESVQRRHAEYYRDRFEKAKVEYEHLEMKEWTALYVPEIGNVRAALKWAFSPAGDVAIGVSLAAAVTPLFLEMSLLSECQLWAERALDRMGIADRHTRRELDVNSPSLLSANMYALACSGLKW